jgi:hypothetical protein
VAEICTNDDIGKQKEAQLNDVFFTPGDGEAQSVQAFP